MTPEDKINALLNLKLDNSILELLRLLLLHRNECIKNNQPDKAMFTENLIVTFTEIVDILIKEKIV